jgi:hypothetical protein
MYDYDAMGQVKSGKKYWSDRTPVAGQQFEYGFDDIGSRTNTKAGGDASRRPKTIQAEPTDAGPACATCAAPGGGG